MNRDEIIISEDGIRKRDDKRNYEYRARHRRRMREREKEKMSNGVMIRIFICIVIAGIGMMIANSSQEKTGNLRNSIEDKLTDDITDNISISQFRSLGDAIKGLSIGKLENIYQDNTESDIDEEYLKKMNDEVIDPKK